MNKPKPKSKPFDEKLSLDLDRATVAAESNDPVRQKFGQIWKCKLEQKIWGQDD